MRETWSAVDAFLSDQLAPEDETLEAVLSANADAGLPAIDVSPLQGRFLEILVRLSRSRRILEIGTLGGFSTICMARALPQGGRILTLEVEARHADVARANFARAGVEDRVDLMVGPASTSLAALQARGEAPFDMVFIDADKPSNPLYLEAALKLVRPGSLIVADNVVREGAVIQEDEGDANIQGVRRYLEAAGRETRLVSTALQTVGVKGWDGFALSWVEAA